MFEKRNLIHPVKRYGGRIIIWACFAAAVPGRLVVIDGTMNSDPCKWILKKNVRPGAESHGNVGPAATRGPQGQRTVEEAPTFSPVQR